VSVDRIKNDSFECSSSGSGDLSIDEIDVEKLKLSISGSGDVDIDKIRAAEFEKCLRKLGPIAIEQRQAIEQLTLQMTNKILHYPIVHLTEASEAPQERETARRTIRKMFGLL